MQRLGAFHADHVQVGLPHIGADELNPRGTFLSEEAEVALEGLDGAFPADPQQAGQPLVNLVDQRQVFVAFGVLNLIHTDGADRLQGAIVQAKVDHILDGIAHPIPGSMERLGGLLPRNFPRPPRQEEHVGFGGLMFAIAPGKFFRHHPATAAVHPTPAVEQENQKAPEGDELETPLGQMIVPRCGLLAAPADGHRTLPRTYVHLDAFLVRAEAGRLVDESPMAVAVV